jgi:hypothetical protein
MSSAAQRTAAEAGREIADALKLDVNIFVDPPQLPAVVDTLRALGIELEPSAALARAARDGMFVG